MLCYSVTKQPTEEKDVTRPKEPENKRAFLPNYLVIFGRNSKACAAILHLPSNFAYDFCNLEERRNNAASCATIPLTWLANYQPNNGAIILLPTRTLIETCHDSFFSGPVCIKHVPTFCVYDFVPRWWIHIRDSKQGQPMLESHL